MQENDGIVVTIKKIFTKKNWLQTICYITLEHSFEKDVLPEAFAKLFFSVITEELE